MRKYAHISIFSQFPVELIDEIARYSTTCELKALCLVSRQTGNVATRRLYHTIILENLKNAVQCFKTLVSRRDVANCVRRIAIDVCSQNLFGSFYGLAATALKCATNLVGLDIAGLDPLLGLLANTTFPRLIEVKIPYTPALTTFLHTHRLTLRAIVLQGPATPTVLEASASHFRNVEMPELMAFVGPCNVIPYVVPGSQVQYLTVCWDPGCERPEEVTRFVAESRKGVVGMDNLVLGWNPTLLGVIGLYIPRMERLRIRNVCSFTTKEMIDTYLVFLEEGLKKFECLHTLAITLLYNPHEYRLEDLDDEYEIIQRWGLIVPTLTVCTLPSTTRWTRFKDNHWFPIGDLKRDPHQPLKMRWFFQAFINGTYPSDIFPEIPAGVDLETLEVIFPENLDLEDEEVEDEDDNEEDNEEEEDSEVEGTDWNESGDEGDSDWGSGNEEEGSEWESEQENEID